MPIQSKDNMINSIALTCTTNELNVTIADLLNKLAATRADIDLLTRLKQAESNAEDLTAKLNEAQALLPSAIASEAQAREDAYYAGIANVAVEDKTPAANVLHTAFSITVTRLASNVLMTETLMQDFTYTGFDNMPQEALGYLVNRQPSAIPAKIMTLASDGDANTAFGVYFAGKRRGYLTA